ncbi:MAG: lipase family protein [Gammaproteobacteria bacterium]|nr:lipase family protein [Gammaproteobacteria bacterium]
MLKQWVFLLITSWAWQVHALPAFTDIYGSAQLADIAYSNGDHQASLHSIGHKLHRQTVLPNVEVNYLLSEKDGVQYITVRGTANLQNALVDLDINLKQDTKLNILVHQGFAQAAELIYQDVQPLLNKARPIQTTGHSLGGAVAVILAMYLKTDGFDLPQVITFGQPKVTNVTGANAFDDLPLLRVVTPDDAVPLVPPLSPLQIKNLDVYWHMGEEMILLPDQQYTMTSGLKAMLRATKFTDALPGEHNLNAHKMQTYLSLIVSKLHEAKEVPYQTGINLFGLSLD